MELVEYLDGYPALLMFVCGLLGLVVGSFLNVLVHRLPKMLERGWQRECHEFLHPEQALPEQPTYNLVLPHSHCPHCQAPIKAWQNIPLLSYAILGGRCGNCRERISLRYPLVEAFTGAISVLLAWHLGLGWPLLAMLLLTWTLISLSLIDADTQLLPDVLVLPVLWLGLLLNSQALFTDLGSAVWGAALGYLSLWSVYWVFKLLTGKEGMGYGDFKLLALIGAWGGWQVLPLTILLSSLVGAILGLIILKSRGQSNSTPLPFGPYIAIAGWVALLWGDQITSTYLQFAGF